MQANGGSVIFGRILGSLAVARAIGDADYKHPFNDAPGDFVSADPFLSSCDLTPEHDYLGSSRLANLSVLACDGLWDKYEYAECGADVRKWKNEGKSPNEVAAALTKSVRASPF